MYVNDYSKYPRDSLLRLSRSRTVWDRGLMLDKCSSHWGICWGSPLRFDIWSIIKQELVRPCCWEIESSYVLSCNGSYGVVWSEYIACVFVQVNPSDAKTDVIFSLCSITHTNTKHTQTQSTHKAHTQSTHTKHTHKAQSTHTHTHSHTNEANSTMFRQQQKQQTTTKTTNNNVYYVVSCSYLVYVRVVRQWSASLVHSNPIPLHTSLQFSPSAP